MIANNPKEVIQYIINLKNQGIDYIKIKFTDSNSTTDMIKQYFSNKSDIIIDVEDSGFKQTIQENQKNNDKFSTYEYVLDNNLSPYEIFAKYVNQNKGEQFISADELIKILSDI